MTPAPESSAGLDVFDALADSWWDEAGTLHGLGVLLAPVRLPFLRDVLRGQLGSGPHHVLDVGAGGGLLTEVLVGDGHSVVAVDPSLLSLRAGQKQGRSAGSGAAYVAGVAEHLPFADDGFDAVLCMEVLEHVDDVGAAISEAARVLRPGGVFVYSGPNRTTVNRIGLVLIAQDVLGLVPRHTHEWSRLIRPAEMEQHMRDVGIEPRGVVGVGLRISGLPRGVAAVLRLLARRISYPDAARQIELVAGPGTTLAYQGFGRFAED